MVRQRRRRNSYLGPPEQISISYRRDCDVPSRVMLDGNSYKFVTAKLTQGYRGGIIARFKLERIPYATGRQPIHR